MIQFNLLPDVKLEYLRTQRIKRLVIGSAAVATVACVIILLALAGSVYGLQRRHISNLTEDIDSHTRTIQSIDQINRILTVQNQLGTINQLHDQKPVTSRLFDYMATVTPAEVSINRIEVRFEDHTMRITGETTSLASVNKFVDTLKFTTYSVMEDDTNSANTDNSERAFSDVVLTSFGRTNNETSYSIELSYEPVIFESSHEINLHVTEQITTRSELERPRALFRTPLEDEESDNGQN